MTLLSTLRATVGDQVTSFEIISHSAPAAVQTHSQTAKLPFACPPYMVLGEISLFGSVDAQRDAVYEQLMLLAETWESMQDVVVAQSIADRDHLWALREEVVICQKAAGPSIKHDVSVPLSAIPELFERGMDLARQAVPGCTPAPRSRGRWQLAFQYHSAPGMDDRRFLSAHKGHEHSHS